MLIKVACQKPTANIIINDETVNTHDSRDKPEKKQKIWGPWKENPENLITYRCDFPKIYFIHNLKNFI